MTTAAAHIIWSTWESQSHPSLQDSVADTFDLWDSPILEEVTRKLRTRINTTLAPTGCHMEGETFYGPTEPTPAQLTAIADLFTRWDSVIGQNKTSTQPTQADLGMYAMDLIEFESDLVENATAAWNLTHPKVTVTYTETSIYQSEVEVDLDAVTAYLTAQGFDPDHVVLDEDIEQYLYATGPFSSWFDGCDANFVANTDRTITEISR